VYYRRKREDGKTGEASRLAVATWIIEEVVGTTGPSPAAKAIYAASMFRRPSSIDALAGVVGINSRFVISHCRELERIGWLRLIRDGKRLRPEVLIPPHIEERIATEIRRVVGISPFKGEATTIFFVEWLVAPSVRLVVHARPDFLRNKDTNQNLEYDVFAPDYAWATEYQGDQHFGPTSRYPSKDAFIERYRRDVRKTRLSEANGIRLSIVHNQILTLDGILGVIPKDIPLRVVDPKGPVVLTLEELGREVAGNQDWDRE